MDSRILPLMQQRNQFSGALVVVVDGTAQRNSWLLEGVVKDLQEGAGTYLVGSG